MSSAFKLDVEMTREIAKKMGGDGYIDFNRYYSTANTSIPTRAFFENEDLYYDKIRELGFNNKKRVGCSCGSYYNNMTQDGLHKIEYSCASDMLGIRVESRDYVPVRNKKN